jgi:glycerophosphoryl diester phosphodiesterase
VIDSPGLILRGAFRSAWELRWPLLLSHLVFSLLVLAVMAPLVSLAIRGAIAFSGQPALSDFDIAIYLLSPVGFVAGLLALSLLLTTAVLDTAFMMAIARDARSTGRGRFEAGVAGILPRLHRVMGFAWRLLLRLLLICGPFVAIALLLARQGLSEYDINYYLRETPPEFVRLVVIGGLLLAVMSVVLVRKLLDWSAALPLVLFSDTAPRDSFARSAAILRGRRAGLLLALIGWAAVSTALLTTTALLVHGLAAWLDGRIGPDLVRLALALGVLLAAWSALNLLLTTLTSGALAQLLMTAAGWPGLPDQPGEAVPARRRTLRRVLLAGLPVAVLPLLLGTADLMAYGPDDEVQVIAHRGASAARPENTMAAFALAIEQKATWVELDVQESADGEVIVIHDSDYMKLANVDLKTWEATLDDIAGIDIGSRFDPAYASERTPLLRDVLALARDSGSGLLIELKYYGHDRMLEQRVVDLVEGMGMADQVRVMSLEYRAVRKMKSLRPDWSVGLLATATVGDPAALEADFFAVNMETVSAGLVRAARAAGKEVYVWTVNDPLAMSHMASLGASGLITDEPALARAVLRQRAELGAAERLVLALGSRFGLATSDPVYRDVSP